MNLIETLNLTSLLVSTKFLWTAWLIVVIFSSLASLGVWHHRRLVNDIHYHKLIDRTYLVVWFLSIVIGSLLIYHYGQTL